MHIYEERYCVSVHLWSYLSRDDVKGGRPISFLRLYDRGKKRYGVLLAPLWKVKKES